MALRSDLAILDDRAAIEVSGPEAGALLQRLVTNDVEGLAPGQARYAALLSPQGKITTDFFVVAMPGDGGFLIDLPTVNAADFIKKLTLYRLRAKVTITDRSQDFQIVAFAGAPPTEGIVLAYQDPRAPSLWTRAIAVRGAVPETGAPGRHAYRTQRILAGVPEGGADFAYGDTFPHEANLDHLNGVDFRKGCYVGQEVVSRVEHRGTARKRIVKAAFDGPPPPQGTDVTVGDITIGAFGSAIEGMGLAMVRLDRVTDTTAPIAAGGCILRLEPPAWA